MPTVVICRGLQGSGKTTWAKKWVNEDPEHRIRINNDDIRAMFGDKWTKGIESLVRISREYILYFAMDRGFDIVVDNMNLADYNIAEIRDMIAHHNKWENASDANTYEMTIQLFITPIDECIARDALRESPIGEKVIRETYERFKHNLIIK